MYIICTYLTIIIILTSLSLSLSQTRTTPWHALYMERCLQMFALDVHHTSIPNMQKHNPSPTLKRTSPGPTTMKNIAEWLKSWILYGLCIVCFSFLLCSFAFAFSHHCSFLPETWAVANEKHAARFTTPVLVAAKGAKGFAWAPQWGNLHSNWNR